ncbi:MAG: ABC transporter permease [Bacteroidota bacterium]
MLKQDLRLAFRNMLRHRRFTILNLAGLAVGLATVMLTGWYVVEEKSYDRFLADYDRIYRVTTHWEGPENTSRFATTPPRLSPQLAIAFEDLGEICRAFTWSDFTLRNPENWEQVFREKGVVAADSSFFSVLPYRALEGDLAKALNREGGFVLTERAAEKYFGAEAVAAGTIVGRELRIGKDGGHGLPVKAVVETPPIQSHFQWDVLAPSWIYQDIIDHEVWTWNVVHTYVKLAENSSPQKADQVLEELVDSHVLPFMGETREEMEAAGQNFAFRLQPITDIHLHSHYLKEWSQNGQAMYVYLFGMVAIIMLVLACVNFVNLSTAQARQKMKRVGVQKVLGALKPALIRQSLVESLVLVVFATALAIGLVEISSVPFQELTGLASPVNVFSQTWSWAAIGGIILLTCLLAGAYPAWYLSKFEARDILQKSFSAPGKKLGLRNSLVVFQFFISTSLILGAVFAWQQVRFYQQKSLGFDKENVLVIQNDREIDEASTRAAFRDQVAQHPGVQVASFSTGLPALLSFHARELSVSGLSEPLPVRWYQADHHFAQALGLELAEGRWFDASFATDSFGIVLNEAAIARLGLQNPLGKEVFINKDRPDEQRLRVIGILKNFHYEAFSEEIKPLAIQHLNNAIFKDYISLRISGGDISGALASIEETWHTFEPEIPMQAYFLDQSFEELYQSEQKLSRVFSVLSLLAIFVACLGLLGLSAFTAEARAKEIGIRKILGASIQDILLLLSRNFLLLVGIGAILAIPTTLWIVQNWLNQFAYQIPLGWVPVVAVLGFSILLTLVTVMLFTYAHARHDPVKVLRDE